MTNYKKYDLIIIGWGEAAFSVAMTAESFGINSDDWKKNIRRNRCECWMCSKQKSIRIWWNYIFLKKTSYKTIIPCENNFDFFDVITNKDNLAKELRNKKYYDVLSKFENVDLIEVNTSFLSNKRIKMKYDKDFQSSEYILEGEKFIIATGSSPNIPNFKDIEIIDCLTNVEAISIKNHVP